MRIATPIGRRTVCGWCEVLESEGRVRIASMLPGATEIVYALGLGDQLVGVSHECDYPFDARTKPAVTQAPFDSHDLSSAEIDRLVMDTVTTGRELYHVDARRLAELQPDLVLTQGLCDVCAVSVKTATAALPAGPRVLSLDAGSLEGLFADIEGVASAAGVPEQGAQVAGELRARLQRLVDRTAGLDRRRVACLEWLDPLYNAGHWVPEMVEVAGGTETIGRKGEHSRRIEWAELVDAAPETLLLMPCGFGAERSIDEVALLARLPGWNEIPAVSSREVWAVDGNSYFSRPGPRLVDGAEVVAKLLHPAVFGIPPPEIARRLTSDGSFSGL